MIRSLDGAVRSTLLVLQREHSTTTPLSASSMCASIWASSSRGVNYGLGRTAGRGLHVWRCASLWTFCRRAARAGRVRAGPALRLELALVVRQHSATGAVRGVARLFVFALSLGRSHSGADGKAERCRGKAHAQSSDRSSFVQNRQDRDGSRTKSPAGQARARNSGLSGYRSQSNQ